MEDKERLELLERQRELWVQKEINLQAIADMQRKIVEAQGGVNTLLQQISEIDQKLFPPQEIPSNVTPIKKEEPEVGVIQGNPFEELRKRAAVSAPESEPAKRKIRKGK